MSERMPGEVESTPMRDKRLGHDLKGLAQDAPEGIEAKPLDSCYYHWQASITGPVGSPYEGWVFYLYLKVPMLYPFRPPEVRFLTKIFHPNVNRHGELYRTDKQAFDLIAREWTWKFAMHDVLLNS